MKYFCTEAERSGTCYHEFQKGRWDEVTFWKEDSLLLHDDIHYKLDITGLFEGIIPAYDVYGATEINELEWAEIRKKAALIGGEVEEAVKEADEWAKEVFEEDDFFTILGI